MKKIGCKLYMHWRVFLCVWKIRNCPFCKVVADAAKLSDKENE